MKRYSMILLMPIVMIIAHMGFGQTDTSFWFVAPEANQAHGDRPVFLRLSTLNNPATVTVSLPANPSVVPIVVVVPANGTQGVDLTSWIDFLENKPADSVLNKGVYIHSSASVSAYYEIVTSCNCNPEIFSLKGKNALGTRFFTPFQTYFNRGPEYHSTIDIVATENNTHVTITPTKNVLGHPSGTPYTITLQKGQTYSVQSVGFNGTDNPDGTLIVSDKPIAITVKEDSVGGPGGCADILGDQIVPVDLAGKQYIVIKGGLNWGEAACFLAVDNNTSIFVNGGTTPVASLNAGESFRYPISGNIFVNSDKPIFLYHVTGYGCELGSALLPSIECTGSSQVGFTRSTYEHFSLNLITRNGNQGSFVLNGNSSLVTASQFGPVPGTSGEWVSAQVSFNTSQVPVNTGQIISNSSGVFHMGLINGGSTSGCRYGYFSDFSSVWLGPDRQLCQGDTTILDAGAGKTFYLWSTGDTTRTIKVTNPGSYWVHAGTVQCSMSDTILVMVQPLPPVSLGGDTTVCGATSYTLTAPAGYAGYTWNNQPGTNTYTVNVSGPVVLEVTDGLGCHNLDTALILIPPPIANIGQAAGLQLSDSLTAWYPFNGNSLDESGNGNHGTVTGAQLTSDRNGIPGSAYSFNGSNNFIDMVPSTPDLFAYANHPRSVAAWLKFQTQSSIIYWGDDNIGPFGTAFSMYISSTGLIMDGFFNNATLAYQFTPGVYYHIAFVYDGGVTISCFANGLHIGDMTLSNPLQTANTGHHCIGMKYDSFNSFQHPFNGIIDDVRIWYRSLSQEEIQCLYSGNCNELVVGIDQDTLCTGGSTTLWLSNSQPGIQYRLVSNGALFGNPQTGNGDTLFFLVPGLAQTTAFTIRASDTASGCSIVLDTTLTVTVNPMAAPVISGITTMCVNSGYYYYSTQTGMSNYQWTVSPGATIIWGNGTPGLYVTWDQPGPQWVAVNYTNSSGCTATTPTQLVVTVNPLPGPASAITGPATVCAGTSGVIYSTPLIQHAVTYLWTLPPGATIASGEFTNTITVDFSPAAQPGTITVYGNNLCGNGNVSPPMAISVNALPGLSGLPAGETSVCEGDTGVVYYVSPVFNATSYVWDIQGGGVITAGNGTLSIRAKFPNAPAVCQVTVFATNSCGQGQISPIKEVTVHPTPETPAISQNGNMLVSSAPEGNQWFFNNAVISNAAQQTYTPMVTGQYSVQVTLEGCPSERSEEYYYIMTGIESLSQLQADVFPVPSNGRFHLRINGKTSGNVSVSVMNGLGELIWQREARQDVDHALLKIDLRPVPAGVYYVVIRTSNEKIIRKMIVGCSD